MTELERYLALGRLAGCPADQMQNFASRDVILQPRQLQASAAARLCDLPAGPTEIGFGGARGGGKSHWLLAQLGADDCQRRPGLKCLLLRKVGKSNLENFNDFRSRLFRHLDHEFHLQRATLTFANGSRIVAGHFQHESDLDAYLGLEYDVIGIEEATTLSHRKFIHISTCLRTSKPDWRPRIYSTTNPGGVGHVWYRRRFIDPFRCRQESLTRFIPARVTDNRFTNPEYHLLLQRLTGWLRRAWLDGDWDIAAGQFFSNFRQETHVLSDFDESRACEWRAALDYGFNHYTVALLGCRDGDGNFYILDEHAARFWLPERHAPAIKAMLARHQLHAAASRQFASPGSFHSAPHLSSRPLEPRFLRCFLAGPDVFSRHSDGCTIASHYALQGLTLRPANADRILGWAELLRRFGDPDHGVPPSLFIHERCRQLLACLPNLLHDPSRPEDVLKQDVADDGEGGDDAADAARYLVNYQPRVVYERRLHGL